MPFCALMAVVPNRFGIYPLVEGRRRQVHPKTTTFCLVLGFTPSGRPSRAHQSQNDLEQRFSTALEGKIAIRDSAAAILYKFAGNSLILRQFNDATHETQNPLDNPDSISAGAGACQGR